MTPGHKCSSGSADSDLKAGVSKPWPGARPCCKQRDWSRHFGCVCGVRVLYMCGGAARVCVARVSCLMSTARCTCRAVTATLGACTAWLVPMLSDAHPHTYTHTVRFSLPSCVCGP